MKANLAFYSITKYDNRIVNFYNTDSDVTVSKFVYPHSADDATYLWQYYFSLIFMGYKGNILPDKYLKLMFFFWYLPSSGINPCVGTM